MGGEPCIRGMRIRVRDILDLIDGGAEVQTILDDFPYLEVDDILAAVDFAARNDVDRPGSTS